MNLPQGQSSYFVDSPTQSWPPFNGAGLLHNLFDCCVHLESDGLNWQSPTGDHAPQPPFITSKEYI
jgi:hypothetical protein